MDEVLLKQITRQLKIINFWITFFGTVIIVSLLIGAIVLFKIARYTESKVQKFESFQQQTSKTLNVKEQLCTNKSLSSLLSTQTDIC